MRMKGHVIIDIAIIVAHQTGFSLLLWNNGVRIAWPLNNPADPWTVMLVMANVATLTLLLRQFRATLRSAMIPLAYATFCIATALNSYQWHRRFDEHFDKSLFQNSLHSLRDHLSREEIVFACVHRYYPILGSDRSQIAFRPLYFADEESFYRQVRKTQATQLIVRDRERHWTGAYRSVRDYVEHDKETFVKIGNYNGYLLFKVTFKKPANNTNERSRST